MNFKRYNESDNSWTDSHYIKKTDTDIITTLPATIYPLAQTATIGLKGNTVQNGTPTPDSSIMPQGTGERTGNLFDINSVGSPPFVNASGTPELTIGTLVDGVFTAKTGLYSRATYINYSTTLAQGTYTISFDAKETIVTSLVLRVMVGRESIINETIHNIPSTYTRISRTFTLESESQIQIGIMPTGNAQQSTNLDLQFKDIMINSGSTVLPYEPYGVKIPISSGSVTTPVYLGQVQTTRQIKKLVLTGEENWRYSTSSQVHWIENVPNDYDNTLKSQITTVCTHYRCIQNNTGFSGMVNGDLRLYANKPSPVAHELYIKDETYTSATDFKSYLAAQYAAGNPVTVWYVLATEETAVVNEPLMRIGDYADSISGISIPTTLGANSLDVDTTVAPSEVTANYSGWHPVSAAHERDNGTWT